MSFPLDAARWVELRRVNNEVNQLPYRADIDRYGRPEFWTEIDAEGGDCEDFALEKRRRLKTLGWPDSALRLATCLTETGGGHCVLTVDTNAGTYVLDNRRHDVEPWKALSFRYTWLKRQAPTGPGWVEIPAQG